MFVIKISTKTRLRELLTGAEPELFVRANANIGKEGQN